jgi:hypothetical protein
MTAYELAALLMQGEDLPVVMSKDPEGNLYRPLSEVDVGWYASGDVDWVANPDVISVRSVVLLP